MKIGRLLLSLVCIFVHLHSTSQTTIGRQLVDQYASTPWGSPTPGLTWLPDDYASNPTKKYPLIIFLHGAGEAGNNLWSLVSTALPQRIAQGWNPQAVNPADGQTYKFIVASPQAPSWSYAWGHVQYILADLVTKYRVDTSRIYVTGLSAGGAGTLSVYLNGSQPAKKFAAIVPICPAGTNSSNEAAAIPLVGGTYGGKVWTICGANDSWMSFSNQLTQTINSAVPAPVVPAQLTSIPNAGHDPSTWNTAYDPNWRSNTQNKNVYEWMLQYTRLSTPAVVNQIPTVSAGPDLNVVLPTNQAMLQGSASDADGTIASYSWSKVSGPAGGLITSATMPSTTVTNLTSGTYIFRLTVLDNGGATASDDVQVQVAGAVNIPPVANAGSDTILFLPANSANLTGSGSDADGSVVSFLWTKVSGPGTYAILNPNTAQTSITNLIAGTYQFSLTVTDNRGAIAVDTVQVIVRPQNRPPIVNAGNDETFRLPLNSAVLRGAASDSDGVVTSLKWRKVAGPVAHRIHRPDSAQSLVDSLVEGHYEFELEATDDRGAKARDTVRINLLAPAVNNCNGIKRYFMPGAADSGLYMVGNPANAGWYRPINPGDTLVLRSQVPWSYFSLEGYKGTPECPIVIMNDSLGPVRMTSGISINSCQYIKVTGSGHTGSFYGIRVITHQPELAGVALGVTGKSRCIEIERAEAYGKTYGVWIKQDPLCDTSYNYPNFIMDSVELHHCRFRKMGQSAVYAGNTDPLGLRTYFCNGLVYNYMPMRLSNINIHHLVIDTTGRSGIQLTGADRGYNQIHNNIISNTGYERNQHQGTGISIGGMTRNCHVYNNHIKNTFLYGIMSFGVGTNFIENNTIDSSGYVDGIRNTESPINILVSPKQTIPFDSTRIVIRNNRIGTSAVLAGDNIALVTWGPPDWARNNVVCGNTKLDGVTPAKSSIDPIVHYINDCNQPVPNLAPTAFAGANIRLFIPADSATLRGSGTDPDGFIATYQWTYVSGPSVAHLVSPHAAHTVVRNLVPGSYRFRLTVMDDDSATASSIVHVFIGPANVAPVINAGPDQVVRLPIQSVMLRAVATDTDGTIIAYHWHKISGPAAHRFSSRYSAQTTADSLVAGVYEFEIVAGDNEGAVVKDTVKVTVLLPNAAPVVSAGPDQTILLPLNQVNLNGSGSDLDGQVASYQWTKLSGPASFTIVNATSAQTVVNNLTAGVYEFELLVTDDLGAIGRDTVMVTVLPAPNLLPVVFAGMDVTITLPINSVPLNGIVADPDGTIASVLWTKISGPSAGNFANSSQVNTTASGLVQGIYEFELSAADNDGAMVRDTMRVTVLPKPNVPPVANAGSDITITLPINYAVLMGSGVDSDGSIVNYEWIKIAGPQNYQIMTPGNPATLVVNMEQGVYQYQLKVIDNSGALAYDTVTVTVIPANLPPVSNAGTDIFLSLPADTATLRGSGTDVDGQVVAYSWRKIAGPDTYRILNTTQAVAKLRDLEVGVYQFELKVTDNNGAIDRDTVIVTVTFDTRRFSTTALYPNPATDILYLTINAQTMKNWTVVQIVDASGRVVQEEQFQRNAPTMVRKIDISSLKAGHYILQFNPEINTHSAIKFIKL